MIKQLGSPDLMLTLSVADNKLPSLKKFYSSLGIDTQNKTLFQLNMANPHYQTLFNSRILECYTKQFLHTILPVKDIFVSFELQDRGTLHTHSLIWFDETKVFILTNRKLILLISIRVQLCAQLILIAQNKENC